MFNDVYGDAYLTRHNVSVLLMLQCHQQCINNKYTQHYGIVGVFLPLIMDEYDQINKPIMTTVFNPLITRLWRINHV